MPDSAHSVLDDRTLTRRRLLRQLAASGAVVAPTQSPFAAVLTELDA